MPVSKNTISRIRSLKQKKFRQKYNKFLLEGEKIIKEALLQRKIKLDSVYATTAWMEKNSTFLTENKFQVEVVSEKELGMMSSLKTPGGVLAEASIPDYILPDKLLDKRSYLYLDGINDPGNLGTILRIADWFGIPDVFCSPDCVDAFNSKVVQSSMGAILRVNIHYVQLENIKEQFPDIPVLGAFLDGESIYDIVNEGANKDPNASILVIGSESHGIRKETLPLINRKVMIPPASHGGAESLNAATATAILAAFLAFMNVK